MRAHPLRSFLALLGLVIGVATLITVMTLVQGANTYVEEKIANLGVRVFQVAKIPPVPTDVDEYFKALRNKNITLEDFAAVQRACRRCEAVGAQIVTGTGRLRYRDKEIADVAILGQTANMAWIGTRTVEHGRYFSAFEEQAAASAAVIGWGVADQFFGGVNAVDQIIRLGNEDLRVVGTIEKIGSVLGQSQDNFILIPLSTYLRLRGPNHSLQLEVRAASDLLFQDTQDEVRLIMRSRRHILPGQKEDFYFGTPDSYLELWRAISGAFFAVFVLISAISALVGGIVIMNIQLVSVSERTKEIGVRRACGARQADILRQFLSEALLQCVAGGVTGVALGFGAAATLKATTAFPADVRLWVAVVGVVFASAIGLFFGIYPAMKAARLDPVVALRSE
jgi:putative ABC transport system permease protein